MSRFAEFAKALSLGPRKRVPKNPRINPRAKSKLFVISQRPPADPVEQKLLDKWWFDYRLQCSATIDLLRYEAKAKEEEKAAAIRTDDAGERKRVTELNKAWNAECHSRKLKKLTPLLDKLLSEQNERMEVFSKLEQDQTTAANLQLAQLKNLSPHCITRDNMDEKVDELFNSEVVDYNFLVKRDGSVLKGNTPLPSTERTDSDPLYEDPRDIMSEDTKTGTSVQV